MLVVGIPAYNEEGKIAKVIVAVKKHADKVIVCDDGSTDATGEIARQLGATVLVHDDNKGYGAALATLFEEATREQADILVTIDADGQHDPAEIPAVAAPILSGEADFVIGSRFLGESGSGERAYRRAGVKAITALTNAASNAGITDSQSGFRAYSKRALASLTPSEMGMGASTEIVMKAKAAGLRIVEVPATLSYGEDSSTHNPVYHGLDVVLATVKRLSMQHPLIFYGVPGVSLLVVALGFWYWALEVYIRTKGLLLSVALLATACTLVGIILMATAVIIWIMISVLRDEVGPAVRRWAQ